MYKLGKLSDGREVYSDKEIKGTICIPITDSNGKITNYFWSDEETSKRLEEETKKFMEEIISFKRSMKTKKEVECNAKIYSFIGDAVTRLIRYEDYKTV